MDGEVGGGEDSVDGTAADDVGAVGTGAAAGAATGRWQPAASTQHATATHSAARARDHRIIACRLADPSAGRRRG